MNLSHEEIRKVAFAGRLSLTDQECDQIQKRLEALDQAADRLAQLDLDQVEASYFGHNLQGVFREDQAQTGESREELFKNVPEQESTEFIEVPAMINDGKAGA